MAKPDKPEDIHLEVVVPVKAKGPVKATIRHGSGRPLPVTTPPPPKTPRPPKGKRG